MQQAGVPPCHLLLSITPLNNIHIPLDAKTLAKAWMGFCKAFLGTDASSILLNTNSLIILAPKSDPPTPEQFNEFHRTFLALICLLKDRKINVKTIFLTILLCNLGSSFASSIEIVLAMKCMPEGAINELPKCVELQRSGNVLDQKESEVQQ